MKNPQRWRPTKFVMRGSRLRATFDRDHLAPGSRFVADILAAHYQTLLKAHARGRLLDLGAGTVPLYEAYKDCVESVTCVDWPQSAHHGEHIDVCADLNGVLPLEPAGYDTVLLTDVLEHVYRPALLLGEIARVLAPGGKLLLGVPFFYWVHEAPHDYCRYTEFMLRRLCEDCGLSVQLLRPTGGSPEIAFDMLAKHLGGWPRLAAMSATLAGWVVRRPMVASASRHSSRWFPQGYVLVAQKPGLATPPTRG
jgi:SAM-dependent methyltransferase